MTPRTLALLVGLAGLAACARPLALTPAPSPAPAAGTALAFEITEGTIQHAFLQDGPIAAHVAVSSGASPRLLVAFPAGNAGIVTWFAGGADDVRLALEGGLAPVDRGGGLRGVSGRLTSTALLAERQSVLGSIRTIRDAAAGVAPPPQTAHELRPGPPVTLHRTTGCERHLVLELAGEDGTRVTVDGGALRLVPAPGRAVAVRFTALQDDPPLTPIGVDALLRPGLAGDPRDLRALAFLAYEEKLLAGSWRFLTYFGRDTLLSLRLMLPALRPEVIEAGLASVIERVTVDGQVAHEEDLGDFAALRRAAQATAPAALCEPLHDHKMVDDDFLLAPVLASYLLDTDDGRTRAAAFLARTTSRGVAYADALRANLAFVRARAAPFAATPRAANLITLQPGADAGEWRDSAEGLGHGRTPWNVNVVLVPAALEAAARLHAHPALGDPAAATAERALAAAWQVSAPRLFTVSIPAAEARARVARLAAEEHVDPAPALAAIRGDVVFPALALDAAGKPIPIQHSDDGFLMLFGAPDAATLDGAAARLLAPFPAGLMTPVGVLVANPAYAPEPSLRALFTRGHYHGMVIWSWQQAMLAAGLRRQLARADLPPATREHLRRAEAALWEVIQATRAQKTGELWSWGVEGDRTGGKVVVVPFGQAHGHVDESNPVQLWSTVYLAVTPPR